MWPSCRSGRQSVGRAGPVAFGLVQGDVQTPIRVPKGLSVRGSAGRERALRLAASTAGRGEACWSSWTRMRTVQRRWRRTFFRALGKR